MAQSASHRAVGSRFSAAASSPGYSAASDVSARLTINGDLRFGEGGYYEAWAVSTGVPGRPPSFVSDVIDVNGLLDLSGPRDALDFDGSFMIPGSVVVAEYETRLSEFDALNQGLNLSHWIRNARAILSYASAEGAGPGQVIVTVVPEPVAGAVALAALGKLSLRRHLAVNARAGGRGSPTRGDLSPRLNVSAGPAHPGSTGAFPSRRPTAASRSGSGGRLP